MLNYQKSVGQAPVKAVLTQYTKYYLGNYWLQWTIINQVLKLYDHTRDDLCGKKIYA